MFKKGKQNYSDQELLAGLQEEGVQHERWVRRLLQQHGGLVAMGMKKFNISKDAAKDAYTDAIMAVSRQVRGGKFREESKLSTYLFRIFSNYCIKQFHKEERQTSWVEEIPNLPDLARNRLQEIIQSEDTAQLYQWMDQLGGNCKEILVLRDFHNYALEQIAIQIGFKTAKSVSSKRHRCLQRLKQLIHGLEEELPKKMNKE